MKEDAARRYQTAAETMTTNERKLNRVLLSDLP